MAEFHPSCFTEQCELKLNNPNSEYPGCEVTFEELIEAQAFDLLEVYKCPLLALAEIAIDSISEQPHPQMDHLRKYLKFGSH